MSALYTPGSYSKNFSWKESYKRLHEAIRSGFSKKLEPVSREAWRKNSCINNQDLELIPLNFFLYNGEGADTDLVFVDRLVELSVTLPYDKHFAQISLFAFHLANSGEWRKSQWQDGRVAGWANEFIRTRVWQAGGWSASALEKSSITEFIRTTVEGQPRTLTKIFTNYHHMLRNAGILIDNKLQKSNFRDAWYVDAVQLFWDRQIFDGKLSSSSDQTAFENAFLREEIYKLLACDKDQGLVFARVAFREYIKARKDDRLNQLLKLKRRRIA